MSFKTKFARYCIAVKREQVGIFKWTQILNLRNPFLKISLREMKILFLEYLRTFQQGTKSCRLIRDTNVAFALTCV